LSRKQTLPPNISAADDLSSSSPQQQQVARLTNVHLDQLLSREAVAEPVAEPFWRELLL